MYNPNVPVYKHKEVCSYEKGNMCLEMTKCIYCFKLCSHREKNKNNRCNIIALVYAQFVSIPCNPISPH